MRSFTRTFADGCRCDERSRPPAGRRLRRAISALRILRQESYRAAAWKNGGGTTLEIAASGRGELGWRLSVATIERDGPFSDFTGHDRTIVPIEGNGIELTFDEVDTIALERRFEPFAFRGERRTWCRLLDGPVRDFNVMTARTAFAHSVTIHDVAEHSKIAVDRPRFAYVLRGGIAGAQAGDTLDVDPGDAISTHDALAGTILAVVTIAPVRFVPTKRRRR